MKLYLPLLLLLALSRALSDSHVSPKLWPCPNPEDIDPCICAFDGDYNLFMDCSNATTSEDLQNSFSVSFPGIHFKSLTINPPFSGSSTLTELPVGVFGPCSFEEVYIVNTPISVIHEEVFQNSHTYLKQLDLHSNEIAAFPIETIKLYLNLTQMDISDNQLPTSTALPNIESDTLRYIDLSGNTGVILSANTFLNAPMLEDVQLSDMDLGITSNVDSMFAGLSFLRNLDLSNNEFSGRLVQFFINPPSNSLQTLLLADNNVSDIHSQAITGLNSGAYVDLSSNNLECLLQSEWKPLLDQVSNAEAIDLRDNPLVCGCDVYWLVIDPAQMQKVHSDTMCVNGTALYDLDLTEFEYNCPAGPDGDPEPPCANRPPKYK